MGEQGITGQYGPLPVPRAALELRSQALAGMSAHGNLWCPQLISLTGYLQPEVCTGMVAVEQDLGVQQQRSSLVLQLAWYFAALHIPLPSLSAQVANVDMGWTLGYMLSLTNMIPSETPQRVVGLQRSNWIAATVLLAVMLILIFCLLTVICCQKNSSGYESL